MKTNEILDKYRKILSGILKCSPELIKFYVSNRGEYFEDKKIRDEIGELSYTKSSDWSLGYYEVCLDKTVIGSFKLYELQHCCAFMVSCNAVVYLEYQNKGIGTVLNQLRQDIGRLLGYSAVLCTDTEQNINQRKLLKTNGWKDIHSLVNKRTQNRVYLSVINI